MRRPLWLPSLLGKGPGERVRNHGEPEYGAVRHSFHSNGRCVGQALFLFSAFSAPVQIIRFRRSHVCTGSVPSLLGEGVGEREAMTTTYTSAYLEVPGYLRAATNQETASLLGLNTTLGGATILAAGAVSLPVAASTGWAVGPIWLLDGPWSEVAQVTGLADSTHLTLAAP